MAKKFLLGILGVIILAGAGAYWYWSTSQAPTAEEIEVVRGTIIEQVKVTGQVTSAQSVDLAFERGGKVATIHVRVGDSVGQGQTLVALNAAELSAQYAQAQASVQSAVAKLEEVKVGTRPEEIQIAQVKVANAQNALNDANTNVVNVKQKADIDLENTYGTIKDTLNDAYAKGDDAIAKQTEELFDADTSTSPQLSFAVWDSQVESDVEFGRYLVGQELALLRSEIDGLPADAASLESGLSKAKGHISASLSFLSRLNDALNKQLGLSESTITTYRGYISTARTNVNTALSNITAKQQAIALQKVVNQNAIATAQASVETAKNNLTSAQSELALKQAGSTPQAIRAQEAAVRQAQANAASIAVQIDRMTLRSPIAGIVSNVLPDVGEIVPANSTMISLISQGAFEIEANVPEVDIAKVTLGKPVSITIDAMPGETFSGSVVHVDPAQTVVDGVTSYKIRVVLSQQDPRIKSGLTANLSIEVNRKEDALILPQVAILETDTGAVVQKQSGETVVQTPIIIGIRGEDGTMEILSGVSEGDKVLNVGKKTQ